MPLAGIPIEFPDIPAGVGRASIDRDPWPRVTQARADYNQLQNEIEAAESSGRWGTQKVATMAEDLIRTRIRQDLGWANAIGYNELKRRGLVEPLSIMEAQVADWHSANGREEEAARLRLLVMSTGFLQSKTARDAIAAGQVIRISDTGYKVPPSVDPLNV